MFLWRITEYETHEEARSQGIRANYSPFLRKLFETVIFEHLVEYMGRLNESHCLFTCNIIVKALNQVDVKQESENGLSTIAHQVEQLIEHCLEYFAYNWSAFEGNRKLYYLIKLTQVMLHFCSSLPPQLANNILKEVLHCPVRNQKLKKLLDRSILDAHRKQPVDIIMEFPDYQHLLIDIKHKLFPK